VGTGGMSESERAPWTFASERQMLRLLIGGRFGPAPEERVAEIREDRRRHAAHVVRRLGIGREDVVVDLGSGCGFMAEPVARAARRLYCLDASPDFAAVCERETAHLPNVSVHVIEPGELGWLAGAGVTKAFSHAVFLHLGLFDCVAYLRGLAAALPPGGLLLLDINDLDRIDTATDPAFNAHLGHYREDRSRLPELMQWHPAEAFVRVARQTGFDLADLRRPRPGAFTEVLLRRR
jgi:cyclopropane fatty-acyl-phospholipid synthase-like methyltransferase